MEGGRGAGRQGGGGGRRGEEGGGGRRDRGREATEGKQLLFAVVCLWNASAAGLLPAICARLRESVYMWSRNVCRQDFYLLPRRLLLVGRGRAGKEGLALVLLSSALAIAHMEAGLEGILLLPALAGPAIDLNDALRSLLFRRLGRYVADYV